MVNLLWRTALLFALCGLSNAHAAVSAELSESAIGELESVRLILRASGTRQTESLDLSELEQDFHVMGTNTSSQYRFMNGREQSWVEYQITLQPKRTGNLLIPSITVGRDQTPTMRLLVSPLSTQTRKTIDELVFFESSISASDVYVQSQLLLTRRLYYSQGVQLYSDFPGAPVVEDAVVLTIGEARSDRQQQRGRDYFVVEQTFAIFPEKSGTLHIPSVGLTASVRVPENGRLSRKGVRVNTEPLEVNVKPVPATYPREAAWLPATNVQVIQVIDGDRADVGDSLTHEVLVHIEGNIGTMAPPVKQHTDADAFRIYPEGPVLDDDTNGRTVRGSRLQTSAIVPQTPGTHSLPPIRIPWWDVVNDELRYSETPALQITVSGQAVTAPSNPDVAASDGDVAGASSGEDLGQEEASAWSSVLTGNAVVWGGICLFILAAFGIWRSGWLERTQSTRNKPAAKHGASENELAHALLRDEIDTASPTALYSAIAKVASAQLKMASYDALALAKTQDPIFARAYSKLEAVCYADNESTESIDRPALARILGLTPKRKLDEAHTLPELYPSH